MLKVSHKHFFFNFQIDAEGEKKKNIKILEINYLNSLFVNKEYNLKFFYLVEHILTMRNLLRLNI